MVASAESSAPLAQVHTGVDDLFQHGRSLWCVAIVGPGLERADDQVRRALCSEIDALELRLDLIAGSQDSADLRSWLDRVVQMCRSADVVTIATARSGGAKIYEAAIQAGVDAVDVEVDEDPEVFAAVRADIQGAMGGRGGVVLIVSHHDFERTPSVQELDALFDRCVDAGADVVKLVSTANSTSDNFTALRPLARGAERSIPAIAFAMGGAGRASRLLAPALGSAVSYFALNEDEGSAPGQLTVAQAASYMPASGSGSPKVFGIFGNPIGHTLSPAMHGHGLRSAGLDAVFVPLLVDDLAEAIGTLRRENLGGVSVTIPFKSQVIDLLDEVDEAARAMGAVNTVVNHNGRLTGYNTDYLGVVGALESALGGEGSLVGKTAVVLGAGGTARAATFGLIEAGVRVRIANRTLEKAQALAAELGCDSCSLADVSELAAQPGGAIADILVNTTSVGMRPGPDESPVAAGVTARFGVVLDAVYSPVRTRLLRDAQDAGVETVTGLEMLLHQGFAQFELWTGMAAPRDAMRAAVMRAVAFADEPVEFSVPGSKSITQRALVCAALARGRSVLTGALLAEDTLHLIGALKQLGARIEVLPARGKHANATITVDGVAGRPLPATHTIELGNNGTATRLLVSMCTLGEGSYRLDGSARLRERPVGPLVDALRSLGGDIRYLAADGYLPLEIRGTGLQAGAARFGDLSSSQYVSSLMLASPYAEGPVTLHLDGKTVSEPYIAMTAAVMERFGVRAHRIDARTYGVAPAEYEPHTFAVEADSSSASYGAAASLVAGRAVRLPGVQRDSDQGDTAFLKVVETFGGVVQRGVYGATVYAPHLTEGDLTLDMGTIPDTVPTAAVAAAFRHGKTTFTGVSHLRIKESDRIAALVSELNRIGCEAVEAPDGLTVHGRGGQGLHGAVVRTYDDHRIAMAFALAALRVPGIEIENPSCVAKSFPNYWERLAELRGELDGGSVGGVVLIGHRATGKSTVGAELANRLGLRFIDTDHEIVSEQRRTIAEIVADSGWARFRDLEAASLARHLDAITKEPAVIATGGGSVTDPRNFEAIVTSRSRGARVVWLRAQPESIANWIERDPASAANRPSLAPSHRSTSPTSESLLQETRRLLDERNPLYCELAQFSVATDRATVGQAATEILAHLATTTGGTPCQATR